MFNCVVIDADMMPGVGKSFNTERVPEELIEREKLLVPFLFLVADKIIVTRPEVPEGVQPNNTDFVEIVNDVPHGRQNVFSLIRDKRATLFSYEPWKKASYIREHGVTIENSLLILAAAGLHISVPNLTFDVACSEEVSAIREELVEEKQSYLAAITRMADETFDRLTSGAYSDTVEWAMSQRCPPS